MTDFLNNITNEEVPQGMIEQEKKADWDDERKRKGIMLFYPYSEERFETWGNLGMIQRKLEGERMRVPFSRGINSTPEHFNLFSSTELQIHSVPHIREELKWWWKKEGFPSIELDGELYQHGRKFDGSDGIHAIASRTVNLHPEFDQLEYHVFDLCLEGEVQFSRLYELQHTWKSLFELPHVKLVETMKCVGHEQALSYLDDFIAEKYEGFILRHPTGKYVRRRNVLGMKFKPHQTDIWPIIGCVEEISKDGTPKNTLGALTCETEDGDPFNVKANLDERKKYFLWQHRAMFKTGKYYAKLSYQRLSTKAKKPICHFKVEVIDQNGDQIYDIGA